MAGEAVLQGGPGAANTSAADGSTASAASATSQVKLARVVLDGVAFDVPENLATAFTKERDRVAGVLGSRLQQAESRLRSLEEEDPEDSRSTDNVIRPPDPKLLDATSDHYDPARYHNENLAYQQALVSEGMRQVEERRLGEQQAAQRTSDQQANWNRQVDQFYQSNPELKGCEDVVDAAWRKNFNALKDLRPEEGFKELAKLSKERIVQLSERGKRVGAPRQPHLETSGTSARANTRREDAEQVEQEPIHGGLGAAIRAKNRRFRTPFQKSENAA